MSPEDAARSFDHRREAYSAFLYDYWIMQDRIQWAEELREPDPPEDALDPLSRRLWDVQVFGTRAAFDRASEAYRLMSNRVFGSRDGAPEWEAIDSAKNALVEQTRQDLRVSDD